MGRSSQLASSWIILSTPYSSETAIDSLIPTGFCYCPAIHNRSGDDLAVLIRCRDQA